MAEVRFQDESVPAVLGESLLEHAARSAEAFTEISATCDGQGSCGECVVAVMRGAEALNPPTEVEHAVSGLRDDRHGGVYRLACQARVIDGSFDVQVVTFRHSLKILSDRVDRHIGRLAPRVRRDGDRVMVGEVDAGPAAGDLLGVALDVGTTSVVAELVDLESGDTKHTVAFENPQRFGGSNVINRIAYDTQHRDLLRRVLTSHLISTIDQLPCRKSEIYEIVVAGNPTMRDLFFGLDVAPLGVTPFLSVTETEFREGVRASTALDAAAADLQIAVNPAARVYGLPLVACHVGADAAAGMLVTRIFEEPDPVLFMDIGTNTEVLLGNRDRILAASSPAGPAFEGAGVSFGMSGMEGAIESIRLEDGSVHWHTIGDLPPRGICGSGLVDLLGELVRTRRITDFGRLADGSGVITVAEDQGITFSDRDISEIAQAKGSNFAAQMILLERFGIEIDDIATLYLAGGFAEFLDVTQAQRIGMVAPVPEARVVKLGNASLAGARVLLCSEPLRAELEEIVPKVEHVRLEQDPAFFDLFVEGMRFRVD
jgi:uncharacterized 2Fe-2S/4Fe-4S cluster protein (DUF4445 family)